MIRVTTGSRLNSYPTLVRENGCGHHRPLADQFEEIFRFQQSDPNEALAFVNFLLATGHDRSVPNYVVLTIRSDYAAVLAVFRSTG